MIVFLGLAIYELFLLFFYNVSKTEKQKKWLYIFACLGLLLVVGLRSSHTGNDTPVYIDHFFNVKNLSWESISKEYVDDTGFFYFIKFIGLFTNSHVIFLLVTAFASTIGVFDLIWRNSRSPVLSLYFYITLGNFFFILTGMRQAIAMSICMLAVRFIQERKLGWFVLFVWLAAQMHHSAYIFIVMYFLGTRKVNIVSMFINIVVTVVAYFSYENLLGLANDILDYDYGVEEAGNGGIFFVILLVINAFAMMSKTSWVRGKKELVILNSSIICNIIWGFRLIGRTAERPSMYWLNTVPVALSESIESVYDRETRLYIQIAAILFTLALFAYRCLGMTYAFCF